MQLFITIFLLFATLVLGGCAVVPSQAGFAFIGETKEPITATSNSLATKTGTACAINLLGIIANGDFSVNAAKEDGKITNVATVDKDINGFFGIYSKVCTVVTGS